MLKALNNTLIIMIMILVCSCRNEAQEDKPDFSSERIKKKEAFIRVNKYVNKRNEDLVKRFVLRAGWKMKRTDSGLWYEIIQQGKGIPAEEGDILHFNFRSLLLDGTLKDSASNNPAVIRSGHGGIGAGLEEALQLLDEGDSARFIFPPHLVQGNFGDGEKYPPGAIVLYYVRLLEVHKPSKTAE